MSRRGLALVCLIGCGAPQGPSTSPGPAVTVVAPVIAEVAAPAVIADSRPVPPDSPPRLLAREVGSFGVLASGLLLITSWPETTDEPTDTSERVETVDPASGARSAWGSPWRAEGWRLRRGSAPSLISFEVSPDGLWVALAYSFELRRNAAIGSPELVALVVARNDGSDKRCVGVGVPSDDPPAYGFARAGKLMGEWTVQCEPGPRGEPVAMRADLPMDTWGGALQWYDPRDGSRGEVPEVSAWTMYEKNPLGDAVAWRRNDDGHSEIEFRDMVTGTRLGAVRLGERYLQVHQWVAPDMLLLHDHAPAGVRRERPELVLVTTAGRESPVPNRHWQIHALLPNGEHLLERDDSGAIEQGRVDWSDFSLHAGRRRPDLEAFMRGSDEPRSTSPWRPGLGGVLIHDLGERALYLAAIDVP